MDGQRLSNQFYDKELAAERETGREREALPLNKNVESKVGEGKKAGGVEREVV